MRIDVRRHQRLEDAHDVFKQKLSKGIHYGMTKAAPLAVARGLAEPTARTGVTMNSVPARPTRSEGVASFVSQMAAAKGVDAAVVEKEFFAPVRPRSLLKRIEELQEVAAAVAFVANPRASAINGAA